MIFCFYADMTLMAKVADLKELTLLQQIELMGM